MVLCSELVSDCNTNFNSEQSFDVRIFEGGRVETTFPTKKKDLKSFYSGIMNLFLTSVHLHEGGENHETEGCKLRARVRVPREIGKVETRPSTKRPAF